MIIDIDTGRVGLPEIAVPIDGTLRKAKFLQTPAFSSAAVFLRSEPWCSYVLAPIPLGETDLMVTLHFYGEQLVRLEISHGAARFGRSWADWSREGELARKAFHEQWLADKVGVNLGPYAWGEISSQYDGNGGCSYLQVSFAHRGGPVCLEESNRTSRGSHGLRRARERPVLEVLPA